MVSHAFSMFLLPGDFFDCTVCQTWYVKAITILVYPERTESNLPCLYKSMIQANDQLKTQTSTTALSLGEVEVSGSWLTWCWTDWGWKGWGWRNTESIRAKCSPVFTHQWAVASRTNNHQKNCEEEVNLSPLDVLTPNRRDIVGLTFWTEPRKKMSSGPVS